MEEKKYWYKVNNFSEDYCDGWVKLTEREAELIDRVSNPTNWKNITGGGYCGSFGIDTERKFDSEFPPDNDDYLFNKSEEQMYCMLISDMDIPDGRKTDWPWLYRNLPIRNKNNPNFEQVYSLVKKFYKNRSV